MNSQWKRQDEYFGVFNWSLYSLCRSYTHFGAQQWNVLRSVLHPMKDASLLVLGGRPNFDANADSKFASFSKKLFRLISSAFVSAPIPNNDEGYITDWDIETNGRQCVKFRRMGSRSAQARVSTAPLLYIASK